MVGLAAFHLANQALPDASSLGAPVVYACRLMTSDGVLHRAALEIRLPANAAPASNEDSPAQITVGGADEAVFPGVTLPQTIEAIHRSIQPTEPGYVQFALNGPQAAYLMALHAPEARDLPAYFFVSRADHRDWHRNWYWASGFCNREAGGAA